MSNLYKLIKKCEALKTGDKKKEVNKSADDKAVEKLFEFMLEKVYYVYNIKKIPKTGDDMKFDVIDSDAELATVIYDQFVQKGLNSSDKLSDITYSIGVACKTDELREVFKWVLDRKNPAKVGVSIVNNTWPKLIHVQPYQGCVPGTPERLEKIDWSQGVLVQEKADGEAWLSNSPRLDVTYGTRTRQGNPLDMYYPIAIDKLNKTFKAYSDSDIYLSSEAMILGETGYLRRETANGLFNSMADGEYDKNIDENIRLIAWDMNLNLPDNFEDPTEAETRYENLCKLANLSNGFIIPVRCKICYSLEDAREFTQEIISNGGEGTIVKVRTAGWKNHKSPNCLKMKNEIEFDCRIIGFEEHSKHPKLIGSLIVESECGKMVSKVGSGLNEWLRSIPFGYFEDKVAPIRCEELTTSKSKDTRAMKHPRILTNDSDDIIFAHKDVANTLEEMEEIEAESKAVKGM